MTSGVTFVVVGTLGVVLREAVLWMVVAVGAGVAAVVETSRVETLSWLVGVGAAVEVVVCGGNRGRDVAVVLMETSTLPVTGCIVLVVASRMMGLRVVVATSGGVDAETVVRVVWVVPSTDGCVTSFRVVVGSISTLNLSVVVLAVVVVTEMAAGLIVTEGRGIVVVEVVVTS